MKKDVTNDIYDVKCFLEGSLFADSQKIFEVISINQEGWENLYRLIALLSSTFNRIIHISAGREVCA